METVLSRPSFTQQFDTVDAIIPPANSSYIYGVQEQRSSHVASWKSTASNIHFVEVIEEKSPAVVLRTNEDIRISLRRKDELSSYIQSIPHQTLYLDITGLSHHVWAPIVAVSLEIKRDVKVVYVEPVTYRYSANPLQGNLFDLSESKDGIAPLPLFARLSQPRGVEATLVPLLGFEGSRLAYMIEEVDPEGHIFPVIGVPGFRPEYPFNSYLGNQDKLFHTGAWQNVRYARANCPFQLFYTLEDIAAGGAKFIKVAPIGTKPHALGAVLYCLATADKAELVYDHPKRKKDRTDGHHHFLLYSVSDFLRANPSSRIGLAS